MASFSILIGAGRILVQESLVMSLKKKKNALLIFLPKTEFLSMALAVLSSNSESYLLLLPQCCNHHPEKNALLILQVKTLEPGGRCTPLLQHSGGRGRPSLEVKVSPLYRVSSGQPWLHRKP